MVIHVRVYQRLYNTRQESAQKMWGHALLYMKIEKAAEGRQNTVLVHLGSSLKSKIISFLLI